MRPLGKHQLHLLGGLARPGTALVIADKLSRSLCKRQLAKEWGEDSYVCITPAGLRALADEADAGRLSLKPPDNNGKAPWSDKP